jgi:hypothetical protein
MTEDPLEQIKKRIANVKAELLAIERMRPGSLTRQFKDPKGKTGAYYQLSYTRQMKSRTEYVPRVYVPELRREIRLYQRFKTLSALWVALCIEESRLRMKRTSRRQ